MSVPLLIKVVEPVDLLEARRILRRILTLTDFLAGYAEGDYHPFVYTDSDFPKDFRLQMGPRKKEGHSALVQTQADDFGSKFAHALHLMLESDDIYSRVNCVTHVLSSSMNIYEKFIRLFAFSEPFLRRRYEKPTEPAILRYKEGINQFSSFMKTAPTEIQDFSDEFVELKYPKAKPLKYIMEAAIGECTELGMNVPPNYWNDIANLRNEVFHGEEKDNETWIRQLIFAGEVLLTMLELLTAKDLGFIPGSDFFARHDRYSTQLGIWKSEKRS